MKNISGLLEIPQGSVEIVSWEYFSMKEGGEQRKVYFNIYDSKVRTAVQSGDLLLDTAANNPQKFASYGFNSAEVSRVRTTDHTTYLSDLGLLSLVGISVIIGGCLLTILLVVILRLIFKNRQQRVTHVVLQPEMSRFLGEDVDDL